MLVEAESLFRQYIENECNVGTGWFLVVVVVVVVSAKKCPLCLNE